MDIRVVAIENYWAPIVKNATEFKQIANAENPEFNTLTTCILRILEDSFIKDSTEYGVSRWEKMLGLVPELNDTLEDRKVRILTYLSLRLPYTWRVLEQMISSFVGEGNYTMSYVNDYAKLTIRIKVENESSYNTVMALLKNVVPQNIVIDLGRL